MTYYEELGIGPQATAEEVRQAYRGLARLLHPDQQGDEKLRRLAEGQMRRLNLVHATLTDPVRRREYDAAMCAVLVPPRKWPRNAWRDAAFFATGLGGACLLWQWAAPPASRAGAAPAENVQAVPARVNPRRTVNRARRGTARATAVPVVPEAQLAFAETSPATELLAVPEPGVAPSTVVNIPPVATVTMPSAVLLPPPSPARPDFNGTWVYVPPRMPASERVLYPPEYIEAVILDRGGVLEGRYRARFRVTDRPISPEVAFRFAGTSDAGDASLTWSGAGGAEGELKLRLLSANSLRVDWLATSLGSQLGLASGTAVLTRRLER